MSQIKKMKRGPRGNWWLWILAGCALLFFVLMKLTDYGSTIRTLNFSEFINYAESGDISSIQIDGQQVHGSLKNNTFFETIIPATFNAWDTIRQQGGTIKIIQPISTYWYMLLFLIIVALPLLGWFLFKYARGNSNNLYSIGKSRARMYLPSQIKTRFSNVAGVAEAKEDLHDVVDFLRNPEKYRKLGAKIPCGVLLVGAPGNGKTLLAKAVAGEANCRFFSISGSDFIEVFVGVGAARVRELFEQARRNAPSIIFIDEIDTIGRQRGMGLGSGGNDEREQTLNQLLTEMDGFTEHDKTVVVLAATNRPDILDKALLRPGRFDRRVDVPYPDIVSREQILQVHLKNIIIDSTVDAHKLARGTPGATGADLENLVNEAAIGAAKKGSSAVSVTDFEEARDRMLLGKRISTILLTPEDRLTTAYHEAGHALMMLMLPNTTDPLHKVTIVPRGATLGVAYSLPERDKYSKSRDEILAKVMVCLGGRVGEELGTGKQYTGVSSDLQNASQLIRNMVCRYGMSALLGPIEYDPTHTNFSYSAHTARQIDEEVHRIMHECLEKTKAVLTEERTRLEKLAQALFERETLSAGEVYELLEIKPREQHMLQ